MFIATACLLDMDDFLTTCWKINVLLIFRPLLLGTFFISLWVRSAWKLLKWKNVNIYSSWVLCFSYSYIICLHSPPTGIDGYMVWPMTLQQPSLQHHANSSGKNINLISQEPSNAMYQVQLHRRRLKNGYHQKNSIRERLQNCWEFELFKVPEHIFGFYLESAFFCQRKTRILKCIFVSERGLCLFKISSIQVQWYKDVTLLHVFLERSYTFVPPIPRSLESFLTHFIVTNCSLSNLFSYPGQ